MSFELKEIRQRSDKTYCIFRADVSRKNESDASLLALTDDNAAGPVAFLSVE